MTIYDSAYPTRVTVDSVIINVNRNSEAPKFVESSYDKTIEEDYPLAREVLTVEANDADGVSVQQPRDVYPLLI